MSSIPPFSGFPPQGLQFWADLVHNNNREWFAEHKQTYLDHVVAPTRSFVQELGSRLQLISPGIQADTRTNGSGSMMRIYRDIRFSKDKTPYKTWMGVVFWEGSGKKTESPSFYFELNAQGARYHFGAYVFPKPILAAYREAVDGEAGEKLTDVLAQVRGAGYEIGGDKYKRVPRGYDKDHPHADLLLYKGLHASSPPITLEQLATPDLIDICFDHSQKMAPLHQWMVKEARMAG